MYNTDITRNSKEYVRGVFLSQQRTPAKHFLCLPSQNAEDVKHAKKIGAINTTTQVSCAENNPLYIQSAKDQLKSLQIKHRFHDDKIQRLVDLKGVDLAYIDLCGTIDEETLLWLRSIDFSTNCIIGFTFCLTPRGVNSFYTRLLGGHYNLGTPKFVNTRSHHINNERIDTICSAISWSIPKIKFNLTYSYNDSRTPMCFIGGYVGLHPHPLFRKCKMTVLNPTPVKVETRLQEFSRKTPKHQQIGGFKIMWNRLSSGQKAAMRRKYRKTLKKFDV